MGIELQYSIFLDNANFPSAQSSIALIPGHERGTFPGLYSPNVF